MKGFPFKEIFIIHVKGGKISIKQKMIGSFENMAQI
jgi:hypothetical protein